MPSRTHYTYSLKNKQISCMINVCWVPATHSPPWRTALGPERFPTALSKRCFAFAAGPTPSASVPAARQRECQHAPLWVWLGNVFNGHAPPCPAAPPARAQAACPSSPRFLQWCQWELASLLSAASFPPDATAARSLPGHLRFWRPSRR